MGRNRGIGNTDLLPRNVHRDSMNVLVWSRLTVSVSHYCF